MSDTGYLCYYAEDTELSEVTSAIFKVLSSVCLYEITDYIATFVELFSVVQHYSSPSTNQTLHTSYQNISHLEQSFEDVDLC